MENLIKEQLLESLEIKVFGKAYSKINLNFENEISISSLKSVGQAPYLVKVFGMKISGACIKLDKPQIVLLPGEGKKPDECGYEGDEEIKMWKVDNSFLTAKIDIQPTSLLELNNSTVAGISAGLKVKNVTYVDGRLTARIEMWVKVLGATIRETVKIDANTGLNRWFTVWRGDIAGASVKVEAQLSSLTKVCVKLKACYDFPWPVGEECVSATECVNF